jgi:succinate dehydrogenase / fumarate reductase membrane anchor subunit
MRIASFLFLVSLFWHAWIGMRNILMDYVHATGVRLMLQILVILSLLFYTVWSAEILWALEFAWR